MNSLLLKLYHRLPPVARSAAATLHGFYLRSWRYGPDYERLVAEALEREQWSAARWSRWREERLAYVLHRAATRVPFYREQWKARRRAGDHSSWEVLENWPILQKESLRLEPRAFLADDCDPRRMLHEFTSGTTGKAIELWKGRAAVELLYALAAVRIRRWHGVSRGDRYAIIGGQLVAPVGQRRPPFWVWNAALQQLYMSSYHLAPDLIPHYLDALARYRVRFLFGYTSSLYALAREALRLGGQARRMAVAITNAEPVDDHERTTIGAAFACPVRESYGMAENAAAASECEHGRLHLWPEVGHVEVFEDASPVPAGVVADLVCTGLLNADMPLIRYRLGDRGALAAADATCACGRTLPVLATVEGRSDDVLYTQDGRRIGRLDPVFKAGLALSEAQIVQEHLDQVRVRYVPTAGFGPEHGQSIVERLQARMGPVRVVLEPVTAVPRTANGKFRAVVCALPPEERETALRVVR